MREAEVHVPFEAMEAMGFDDAHEAFQEATLRDVSVVSCDGPECIAAVTYSDPVDDALTDAEYVEWWERLERDVGAPTYLCKTVTPALSRGTSSCSDPDPVVQSVTPTERGFAVSLVGEPGAFRTETGSGPALDVPLTLRRLTDYEGPTDELAALTSRQREVLETAYDLGYYEVPRETSAAEIARRLDLDRSTVTEHLQRAERNLLSTVLSR